MSTKPCNSSLEPIADCADGLSDPQLVCEQCERILADPLFSQSKRCTRLLRYIVQNTLEGTHDCLKERIIGIEVFGRPADYNTSDDATVRVGINEVRKRLTRYFDHPAHKHELRIVLPTGSYVAKFEAPEPPPIFDQSRRLLAFGILVATAAIFIVGVLAVRQILASQPLNMFWAPLLNQSGPLLITLGDPVRGDTSPSPVQQTSVADFIRRQSSFPIAELSAANSISSFFSSHKKQSLIRLASSTAEADLAQGPVVMLGSYLNHWAMQRQSTLRFQFRREKGPINWISDSFHPENQTWAVDFAKPVPNGMDEYAIVTRELDPVTHKYWVGIGGATVLGTLAAEQFLLDSTYMARLESQLPSAWARKNVQMVLGFRIVDGQVAHSNVIATYVW